LFFSCRGSVAAPRATDWHTIKDLRRTMIGAAGSGLGTTIKYLRGAAGNDLGASIKYLRRATSGAASNCLEKRLSTCDAQRAAPRATAWAS
jgi:hypothetical protein